jgi:hypothetical protein
MHVTDQAFQAYGRSGLSVKKGEHILLLMLFLVFFIYAAQSNGQSDSRFPAKAMEFGDIHQFPGRTIGFAEVVPDLPGVAYYILYQECQFTDLEVFPRTNVDQPGFIVLLHQKKAGISKIIGMEELPAWLSRTPKRDCGSRVLPCFVKFSDQGRQNM